MSSGTVVASNVKDIRTTTTLFIMPVVVLLIDELIWWPFQFPSPYGSSPKASPSKLGFGESFLSDDGPDKPDEPDEPDPDEVGLVMAGFFLVFAAVSAGESIYPDHPSHSCGFF
eukprot:CAMPEP_0183299038 /NCGR_PEP_ID=MMETSP0160_2-20130417/5874_1 /TAXON_ID=2839 ORGANISM="Odontella Sinensis, Strain Grunow 1884" /NCGR_SAMPLE_ID=MMETSP0160_2 /ASSEMBLY_ACC=CAM_ASM_000250 /LENGTH=113 /DNA_ID=CAMNT_0025461189 /DNA_START=44 /DNA_END=382 /DNA_ORIENTATION=+